ncbi:hypothetical protein GOODEAATRI_032721, partial [Goodea atripinnis]
ESRHTLDVDITSRMFTDASIRVASRKDSITASVWSPSAGFLGLHLQRRSSSQLQGKLFSRYLSTPGKDTNVLTAKASLRNSDKLVLQTSWNWDSVSNLIAGFKDRIPLMTNALLKFINKYHTTHFSIDLNQAVVKLRNAVVNLIERVYQEVPVSFSMLQGLVESLADQGKDMYTMFSNTLMFTDLMNLTDVLIQDVGSGLRHTWYSAGVLLEPGTDILNNKNFSVPGSVRKLPIRERFQQGFSSLREMISDHIRRTEFTIPGTEVVLNGNKIMKNLKWGAAAVHHHVMELLQRTLNNVLQLLAEKAEHLHVYLKDSYQHVSPQVQAAHSKIIEYSTQHTDEAKRRVSEYKELVQLKVHEAYNASSMERVNSATKDFFSVVQSNLSEMVNESLDVLKKVSQSTAPYIRVGKDKVDVEIPLPFLWKSFSEWPTLFRP